MAKREFGEVIRGIARGTEFARIHLGEPDLTEKTFTHWVAARRVRSGRFGGQVTFKTAELAQDLAGIPQQPPVVAA